MAKNKSVYEIMGDTSALLKEPEYEVHASKNPQDHFVQQKSVQTRLAEDKGYQAKKLNDAILKTAGQALQSFGQLKGALDKDRILLESNKQDTMALTARNEFEKYKAFNSSDYYAMTPEARTTKRAEFFEESNTFAATTHENVQAKYGQWFNKWDKDQELSDIKPDVETYVTAETNTTVKALISFNNLSQTEFNEKANNKILALANTIKLPLNDVNKRIAKIGVARLKENDDRLYNYATAYGLYSTADAQDTGLAAAAVKQFEKYEDRIIAKNKETINTEFSSIIENNTDSSTEGVNIYNMANIRKEVIDHQKRHDLTDGEGFKALLESAAYAIKNEDYSLYEAVKNITDHEGDSLLDKTLYETEIQKINTALSQMEVTEKEATRKELLLSASNIVLAEMEKGASLQSFEDRNFNSDLDPVRLDDFRTEVVDRILTSHEEQLDSIDRSTPEGDAQFVVTRRAQMNYLQQNGIINSKWQGTLSRATERVVKEALTDANALKQVEQAVNLFEDLRKVSPMYANNLQAKQSAILNDLIALQEISGYSLEEGINIVSSGKTPVTKEESAELLKDIVSIISDNDSSTVYATNDTYAQGAANVKHGMQDIRDHVTRLVSYGVNVEDAIKTVKENYIDLNYRFVNTNKGKNYSRLIDIRGLRVSLGNQAETYAAHLPDFLLQLEEKVNRNVSDADDFRRLTLLPAGNQPMTGAYIVYDQAMQPVNTQEGIMVVTGETLRDYVLQN